MNQMYLLVNNRFLIDCCFKGYSNGLKFEKTSEQSKSTFPVSWTPAIFNSMVSLTLAFCISPTNFPVSMCCKSLVSQTRPFRTLPFSRTPAIFISPVSQTLAICTLTVARIPGIAIPGVLETGNLPFLVSQTLEIST